MSKVGRKRKVGIKRQPNGQPYRPPADPREVVVSARMRQFGRTQSNPNGLTKETAKLSWAGYEIGRMALRGVWGHPDSHEAHEAIRVVEAYVTATAAYMRYKCPQMPMPKAMDYLAGRGVSLNGEPSNARIKAIVDTYTGYLDKLAKAGGVNRMYFHEVAFHDKPCAPYHEESVKACVKALRGC